MGQYHLSQHTSTITPGATLSRFIGPIADCSDFLWGQLTDFENWPNWSSNIRTVTRTDAGSVGRGSKLDVTTSSGTQCWHIAHWDPGKRIDFIVESQNRRLGYSFVFNGPSEEYNVELRLSMEFEFSGMTSLFSRFLQYCERKKAVRLFEELTTYVENLGNKGHG